MNKSALPAAVGGGDSLEVEIADSAAVQLIHEAVNTLFLKDDLRPQIWSAAYREDLKPLIRLVPLARVGASPGFSGAHVFVCYLMAPDKNLRPSRALVVKVGDAKKIKNEYDNALELGISGDAHFATPIIDIMQCDSSELAVLIAPFSSQKSWGDAGEHTLQVVDLWSIIDGTAKQRLTHWANKHAVHDLPQLDLCSNLRKAYTARDELTKYVKPPRDDIDIVENYCGYQRGLAPFKDSDGKSSEEAVNFFGTGEHVDIYNSRWDNPVHVAGLLIGQWTKVTVSLGKVHGDLHPHNIVLNQLGEVSLIDFGWARADDHLVKDFVLMEANLRFMTLSPYVPEAELLALAQHLSPDDTAPILANNNAKEHYKAITFLWDKAKQTASAEEWDLEYLLPLFMVSYGLFKYLDTARNQTSAILTLLCLAKRVKLLLPSVIPKGAS